MKEQDHTEQHLDSLAKKVMKLSLESPSKDFTSNIMSNLENAAVSKPIVYKPLISKAGWFIIAAIIACIAYFVNFESTGSSSWLNTIDTSVISNNKMVTAFSGLTLSKIAMYALGLFGAMWFVQVQFIKYQFEKRLNY